MSPSDQDLSQPLGHLLTLLPGCLGGVGVGLLVRLVAAVDGSRHRVEQRGDVHAHVV